MPTDNADLLDCQVALAELNAQLSGMSVRAQQLAIMVAQRDRQIAALQTQLNAVPVGTKETK